MEEDEKFFVGMEEKSNKVEVEDNVKKIVGSIELQEIVLIQVIS